jgi:hypothetical protein
MVTRQNATVKRDLDSEIGLGWFLGDRGFENCGTFAFHDGGKPGVSSLLLISPDAKIGVALLSNTGSAHPALYEIGHEVLRVMYESLKGFTPKAREAPHPIDVPHGELTRLEGLYANEMLGLFEIQVSGRPSPLRKAGAWRCQPGHASATTRFWLPSAPGGWARCIEPLTRSSGARSR